MVIYICVLWCFCGTATNRKQVNRNVLVTKRGVVADLMAELKTEVAFLAGHLFRAGWQHHQFKHLQNATPFPALTI